MSTMQEVSNKDAKIFPFENQTSVKKLTTENIFPKMQISSISNPIDPNCISKELTNSLTKSSLVKAGLVFLGTITSYYILKNTRISSYFGWGKKNSNLKDFGNNEIVSAKKSLSVRMNLETTKQINNNPSINRIAQTYRGEDRTVEFEEIKVEEFKAFSNLKKENVKMRRSINVQNPIPNQNVIVGKPFELTIDGAFVFSSSSALSLAATNISDWLISAPSNPTNPTLEGFYNTNYAYRVAIFDYYAYVADGYSGLQIIDISNPSNPTFKGSYDTPGNARGIAISGNYAYVADLDLGLQIVDVSDPLNPTFVSSYDTPDDANEVAISGNYAYVAVGASGLQIIDISNPSNPTFKGAYNTPGDAGGVALSGNYAYVADEYSGLQIIDIRNPAGPTLKGSYDIPSPARGVAVSGNYAYVAAYYLGLYIIDISDPSNPTIKGSYNTPGEAWGVAVSGNYAYVVSNDGFMGEGLQIVDIKNPAYPEFKDSYNTGLNCFTRGVTLSGNYAYIACGNEGLKIIALNSNGLTLLGTPSSVGTYSINIKACNEELECATNGFDIIVENSPSMAFSTTLTIAISISVAVCISSFWCALIGGGIIAIRRYYNKGLENKSNTKAKEKKKEEELQKMENDDDKKIVVDNELSQPIEE
jgi:hypothetical protein